jgi:glycosyltransferase XagB
MTKKIGEHLLEHGLVSEESIERALSIQEKSGVMLGQILQAEGMISAYHFYEEFAKFKNLPFVNLAEYKVDYSIMEAEEKEDYRELQFIPFDAKDKIVHIATTDPSVKLLNYLDGKFHEYKIFITSPFDILWTLQKKFNPEYIENATENLFENLPSSSSKFVLDSTTAKATLIVLAIAILYACTHKVFLSPFLWTMNIFFFLSMLSKIFFFINGIKFKKEMAHEPVPSFEHKEMPIYSILVPLYQEKENTIKRLLGALHHLDYPKEKLDIKLIVEMNDHDTINIIKKLKPFPNYYMIKVPENTPQTKPKACNYALNFCHGEFVTIYDAEDCPDPDQLKKALAKFYDPNENISCVQSRLNYYNRTENTLTKLFALEFASWFDYILYGLQKLNVPIPLGGTSNHFRIKILKSLYAWDPYNVTEDADLGVRLALAGLKTVVIDSYTYEEAPIKISAWLNQRARWIKGYFQTFIVHSRSPVRTIKTLGFWRYLGFFFFVGAPGFVYFFVPLVIAISAMSIFVNVELSEALIWFSYRNLELALICNFVMVSYIIHQKKWKKMWLTTLVFPFYWLLHCMSSYKAVYQLIKKPHHWDKTEHGVSKFVTD